MAFGTRELEVKPGLVRENYEFGFGPVAFEMLASVPMDTSNWQLGKWA